LTVVVFYSEDRKGDLLSLGTLLYEKNISFKALVLPLGWSIFDSEDLLFQLKSYSHSLFLVSSAFTDHPFFIFAVAYCLGAHEKTFLLDSDGGTFPEFWQRRFTVSRSFAEFIQILWEEKERWEESLQRSAAKVSLSERGVEVSNSGYLEAVISGDATSVELFLKAGFSPDHLDRSGVPVLILAVRNSHFTIVRLLLDFGASVDIKARDRETTALMDAASLGNGAMVQELIERGCDLDSQSKDGQTALTLAVGKGDDQCALLLLDAGANPHLKDKLGMSAYKYAILFSRQQLLSRMPPEKP
jgi:hypothetical protein